MDSPTVNSIERIRNLVDQMRSEGTDPLFIYAALAQVMADLEPDTREFAKSFDPAELGPIPKSEMMNFFSGCEESNNS